MNKKKLTIAQTPPRYFPFIGGVEKYTFDLSNELVKLGHTVTVICADEPQSKKRRVNGVSVIRLPFIGKIANTNITLSLPFKLSSQNIDIIHTHIPTPWSADISMIISLLKRKPLVVTYHNDILKTGESQLISKLYNNFFLKLLLSQAASIIVTQKKYINRSHYLSQYKNKIKVIPNGVDLNLFSSMHLKRDKNTIFFLSSLDKYHRYKGLDTLIKATAVLYKSNKDIKLLIGGSGDLVSEYKELVNNLQINNAVLFLGRIPQEKINYYFQKSTVFVLPSKTAEEGFGIVLLEALANKTPVVTTHFSGITEDIKKFDAGIIVPKNNTQVLAHAIDSIIKNPDHADLMGRNGRQLIKEKYTWQKIARDILSLYYTLI